MLTKEQEAEIAKFRQEQIDTRKQLRNVQFNLRRDVESLGTWVKVINVGAVPVAVIAYPGQMAANTSPADLDHVEPVADNTASQATIKGVIDNIDKAINTVNDSRAVMGASQNRFESVVSNLQISVENQSAARSRILDTDYASETANLSRAQILGQAGNAMIAQANQLPQQVLSLLR